MKQLINGHLRASGLSELKILAPFVSQEGILALGKEFWQDLLNAPPIIILEANKL